MSAGLKDGGPGPVGESTRPRRLTAFLARARALTAAVRDADETAIQEALAGLTRRQRLLAPLALAIGGVDILFHGVRILITNWRLLLVQILPVGVTWMAMYDLKGHVLSRHSLPAVARWGRVPLAA